MINRIAAAINRFMIKYENLPFYEKERSYLLLYFLTFIFAVTLIFFIQRLLSEGRFIIELYYASAAVLSGIVISLLLLKKGIYYKSANMVMLTILSTLIIVDSSNLARIIVMNDLNAMQIIISTRHLYPAAIAAAALFCSKNFIKISILVVILFSTGIFIYIQINYTLYSSQYSSFSAFHFLSFIIISIIALLARKLADDAYARLEDHINNLENIVEQRTLELTAALKEKESINAILKNKTDELIILKNRAENLARTDALTGLNNQFAFMERAALEIVRVQRHNRALSVLIADIDHFKAINDTYGHKTGDIALKKIADTLHDNLRSDDFLARIGGEEFAILLPETDIEHAVIVAEKIRKAIEQSVNVEERWITCSIGVATRHDNDKNINSVLQCADEALYRAKMKGRNRVERG